MILALTKLTFFALLVLFSYKIGNKRGKQGKS